MKKFILIAVLALSCTSFAWVEKDPTEKVYTFKYQLNGQTLELRKPAQSYEDAFQDAAQKCFNYYKGQGKLSEEKGLDIIDVCANPRS
jgi:hypothetical protein